MSENKTVIDKLIINSPYQEPQKYWSYNRERRTFHREDGRRPAGYVIASQCSKSFDNPGIFVEIELVNKIRPRVKKWIDDGYQGVTGITKRLLNHWCVPAESKIKGVKKEDLNRKKAEETEPLPDLVTNAYYLLGKDWLETKKEWEKEGHKIPPVMITVANRTETSARIKYSFDHNEILIPELCIPEKTLHIDSKVLEMAEAQNEEIEIGPYTGDVSEEQANGKKLTKKQ